MALFKNAQTTSNASGTPYTPVELYGVNVPGGGVSANDGLLVRARCSAVGAAATFTVKLGNVTLLAFTLASGVFRAFDLTVLRETTSAGNWRVDSENTDSASAAFSWTSQMRLSIAGQSADEGGAVVQNACANW